jgi:plasmid stabilization system protein ParE
VDLVHIVEWYEARHPGGSERFAREFARARDVLATFPLAGRERGELSESLRSFVVHPWVLFYGFDELDRVVTVQRVVHGRMDFDADDFEDD